MDRSSSPWQWDPHDITQVRAIPGIEVLQFLGSGGMGAVYLARQVRENRFVALKVARVKEGGSRKYESFIVHEAQVMSHLSHENIVKVYDFGVHEEQVWVVMEFIGGSSVRDLLDAHQMSPKLAFLLAQQLCAGLHHAHTRGVIHHDLKPANILVDSENRVKIADFGISWVRDFSYSIGHKGRIAGTVRYMAPERQRFALRYDHRSDIYSLGVVMYEMMTGRIPHGTFLPPSQVIGGDANELDRIVLTCLNANPNNRWQSAAELLAALRHVVSDENVLPNTPVIPQSESEAQTAIVSQTKATSFIT